MKNEIGALELAGFRQRFAIRPQRQRMGFDLSQTDAVRILADADLTAEQYQVWRAQQPADVA